MRTHADIISDAGGATAVRAKLELTAPIHTVRSWAQRDSIPAEHWAAFDRSGLATLPELACAAEERKRSQPIGLGVAA